MAAPAQPESAPRLANRVRRHVVFVLTDNTSNNQVVAYGRAGGEGIVAL